MSKMFINFNKDGKPIHVVNEETFEGMVKAKIIEHRYDWDCYTPEQKYIIPWLTDRIVKHGLTTLEDIILEYIEYVYNKYNKIASKTAIALDMDRKTLYRYLKKIENNKFLNNEDIDEL